MKTRNPTYVLHLQSCIHLLWWSTLPRGAESSPPPSWGWISPALASHIFHHVPILMRPNNNNKHFNAPSLRKSHVWWGHESELLSNPRWGQHLRNNNISEHSWERKFAGCDGRSPLPREMWRFPWCVVTEDIFSFLANFLRKYEGNNRDCQNWLYGFSPSYLRRAFLIFSTLFYDFTALWWFPTTALWKAFNILPSSFSFFNIGHGSSLY